MNSTVLELTFAIDDLNEIKYRYLLATIENNTFITFPGRLIRDMNGRRIVPIMMEMLKELQISLKTQLNRNW